ncbi:transcription factor Ouib-like [Drosophila persimilis]|uniref:transcription factor Ouib-like n=1 Tax=Drosophila persimilis TaxID=7234 RepID=UPI000F07F151|nr:transcription factor Ouib-like [Drosophila persimilis]
MAFLQNLLSFVCLNHSQCNAFARESPEMALLCRTCGEYAVNPRKLFDENGNDILNDILKLTGIWLTNRTGFPSHICASCLQQTNEAMGFRELCIRTNKHWYATADSKTTDAVHPDPLMGNEGAAIPKENKEYVKVEIETLYEEVKPASPLSPHASSNRQSEQDNIANDGDVHDDFLDLDLLINEEDAAIVVEEENNDEINDIPSPLSSPKLRLDSCSITTKGVLRGSRKSNVDPLPKRKRYRSTRGYYCDQCGKWFKDKCNLNVHLKRHTGVKQFECEECGRKELTMHLLSLHIRVKHKGELPYTCKYCGQRFDNCIKRLNHERHHKEFPDIRPHVCPVCGKAFQLKAALRRHEIVHTGEQPFHCETCDVFFNRKSSLQTHNRSKLHIKKVEQDQTKTQIDVLADEDNQLKK